MDQAPELPDFFVLDDAAGADAGELGRLEGRREGELLAYRHALRMAMELRFGSLPHQWLERIGGEADVGKLRAWHLRAVVARSLEQVEV